MKFSSDLKHLSLLFCSFITLWFFSYNTYANPCETTQKPVGCCKKQHVNYQSYWPSSDDLCNCNKMEGDLEASLDGCTHGSGDLQCVSQVKTNYSRQIGACAEKAQNKVHSDCTNACTEYIKFTTKGCTGSTDKMIRKCPIACAKEDIIKRYLSSATQDIDFISNNHYLYKYEIFAEEERNNCLNEAEGKLIESCKEKIQEIERKKGERATLLCEEGASKDAPKCTEYCKKRIELAFKKNQFSKETLLNFYAGLNRSSAGYLYKSLTGKVTDTTLVDLTDHIDPSTTIITSAGKRAGLLWYVCKKGDPCESEIARALDDAAKTCSELQERANECCEQPEQCVGGGLAHALDGLGKLNLAVAGMKGMKEQCEAVQQTHGMYGGMQGLMASRCTKTANDCVSECSQAIGEFASVYKKHCSHDPRNKATYVKAEHTCDEHVFKYQDKYRSNNADAGVNVSRVPNQCKVVKKEANRRIQDMSTNMAAGLLASMEECDRVAEENGWDPVSPDPPNPNNPTSPMGAPPGIGEPPVNLGGGGNSGSEREGRRGFRRGKKEGRKAASLDLKKLLPKGKQLNHKIGKYGSPHDDIFQRLSDRIQWMCKTDKIKCH